MEADALMAARKLMTVRTELVLETMVARLIELVREEPDPKPEQLVPRLGWDSELASAGYKLRRVEWRLFEQARDPAQELALRLAAIREGSPPSRDAIGQVADQLARLEPIERPAPDDENAITWRVPGPGGHVRHYAALELLGPRPAELKRAAVYGFLIRCAEETLDPGELAQ